ncbi:hypothetical protein [Jatrophihabitans fulvus]
MRGPGAEHVVLVVADVFTITGRGTVVTGAIGSGGLHNGDEVEIVRDGRVVARARALVDLVCSRTADPSAIALVLPGVGRDEVWPGDTIRRRSAVP